MRFSQIVFGIPTLHNCRLLSVLALLFGSISFLSAQAVLSGKVLDGESGEPLLGATLLVLSTAEGAVTDFDGAFELRTEADFPLQLQVTYVGYDELILEVAAPDNNMKIELGSNSITIDAVEIKGQRISDKQKSSPLTVESLDVLAIKETPSDNFYDGLGSLKGVDLTAASLGFKVINTRGFNSTSPVRTLQLIDGVDNQAPGLNFSLGNFLGSSELDVLKVDLIQGASSAFYGPNAFNGVISMTTKNPFASEGLSARIKTGERNLFETAVRWADVLNNKEGKPVVGYKFNFSYLRADDWEADNYDPVDGTETGIGNPGRYDAVNIYGDEYSRFFDYGGDATTPWGDFAGLGQFHRTGYREIDLVDYDTRNLKASMAWHFRLKPDEGFESPEIIASSSFGTGTTVYQGDNRFSLRDILFFQHRLEYKKTDKYFIRLYATQQDAGNSYDPYFTALRLQDRAVDNAEWGATYTNYWLSNIRPKFEDLGYPELEFGFDEMGNIIVTFDNEAADSWMMTYQDSLTRWHNLAMNFANQLGSNRNEFLEPGTPEFEEAFNQITSAKSNAEEEGTGFFDRSALYHGQGEYKFEFGESTVVRTGASGRLYTPRSDGTIFYDTAGIRITNYEFGFYGGIEQPFWDNRVTASATLRVDKNQNFPWLASPAASIVYKPKANNYLRVSFSSAIRNPTLTDQFLFLNVGPATLAGNIDGVDSLITINSFLDFIDSQTLDTLEYFNIAGVRPERVQTIEFGYRTTLWNKLYVDLGYYFNVYDNFLGFRLGVDSDFNQFGIPINTTVYRYAANSTNQVTTQGASIGLNYYFGDYFMASANYSWNRLNKQFEDDPIIPAFNTPEHKFNLGLSGRGIVINLGNKKIRNLGFNVNYKWIEGFLFEGSPQFTGFIPSYDLLDAQINWKWEKADLTFKVGASNLLNNMQFQAYGGPRIGRLAYASVLYEFQKQ